LLGAWTRETCELKIKNIQQLGIKTIM